jgi:hypothetical protein
MSATLSHLIVGASALLAGAILALKVIAPLTSNTVDDSVLERLEQLEGIVQSLHLDGSPSVDPAAAPAAEPAK